MVSAKVNLEVEHVKMVYIAKHLKATIKRENQTKIKTNATLRMIEVRQSSVERLEM